MYLGCNYRALGKDVLLTLKATPNHEKDHIDLLETFKDKPDSQGVMSFVTAFSQTFLQSEIKGFFPLQAKSARE